jgi:hypothetical protein
MLHRTYGLLKRHVQQTTIFKLLNIPLRSSLTRTGGANCRLFDAGTGKPLSLFRHYRAHCDRMSSRIKGRRGSAGSPALEAG